MKIKKEQKREQLSKNSDFDYGVIYNFVIDRTKKLFKLRQKYLLWILIAVAVGASGVSIYFYDRYHQATQDPQKKVQAETDRLLARVSKIVLLPGGETPTIATISDPDKLKNQAFFSDSQRGDKVLIYTNAKKVFIYRPSINKIISVAPLLIEGSSEFNTPAPTPK